SDHDDHERQLQPHRYFKVWSLPMIIFFALMIVAGVIFGTGTVAVDLGHTMDQQTVMQNSADAGVLAAARLMAGSVTNGTSGPVFMVPRSQVYQTAKNIADANHSVAAPGVTYTLSLDYLDCSGCAVVVAPVFGTDGKTEIAFSGSPAICEVRATSSVEYPAM